MVASKSNRLRRRRRVTRAKEKLISPKQTEKFLSICGDDRSRDVILDGEAAHIPLSDITEPYLSSPGRAHTIPHSVWLRARRTQCPYIFISSVSREVFTRAPFIDHSAINRMSRRLFPNETAIRAIRVYARRSTGLSSSIIA